LHRPVSSGIAAFAGQLSVQIIQFLDAARRSRSERRSTDAMKIYDRDVLKEITWHP